MPVQLSRSPMTQYHMNVQKPTAPKTFSFEPCETDTERRTTDQWPTKIHSTFTNDTDKKTNLNFDQ